MFHILVPLLDLATMTALGHGVNPGPAAAFGLAAMAAGIYVSPHDVHGFPLVHILWRILLATFHLLVSPSPLVLIPAAFFLASIATSLANVSGVLVAIGLLAHSLHAPLALPLTALLLLLLHVLALRSAPHEMVWRHVVVASSALACAWSFMGFTLCALAAAVALAVVLLHSPHVAALDALRSLALASPTLRPDHPGLVETFASAADSSARVYALASVAMDVVEEAPVAARSIVTAASATLPSSISLELLTFAVAKAQGGRPPVARDTLLTRLAALPPSHPAHARAAKLGVLQTASSGSRSSSGLLGPAPPSSLPSVQTCADVPSAGHITSELASVSLWMSILDDASDADVMACVGVLSALAETERDPCVALHESLPLSPSLVSSHLQASIMSSSGLNTSCSVGSVRSVSSLGSGPRNTLRRAWTSWLACFYVLILILALYITCALYSRHSTAQGQLQLAHAFDAYMTLHTSLSTPGAALDNVTAALDTLATLTAPAVALDSLRWYEVIDAAEYLVLTSEPGSATCQESLAAMGVTDILSSVNTTGFARAALGAPIESLTSMDVLAIAVIFTGFILLFSTLADVVLLPALRMAKTERERLLGLLRGVPRWLAASRVSAISAQSELDVNSLDVRATIPRPKETLAAATDRIRSWALSTTMLMVSTAACLAVFSVLMLQMYSQDPVAASSAAAAVYMSHLPPEVASPHRSGADVILGGVVQFFSSVFDEFVVALAAHNPRCPEGMVMIPMLLFATAILIPASLTIIGEAHSLLAVHHDLNVTLLNLMPDVSDHFREGTKDELGRLTQSIEATPLPGFIVSMGGDIVFANPEAAGLVRQPCAAALVGKSLFDLLPALRSLIPMSATQRMRTTIRFRSGLSVPVSLVAALVDATPSSPPLWIIRARDISQDVVVSGRSQAALAAAPFAVFHWSADSESAWYSDSFSPTLALSFAPLASTSPAAVLASALHPDDWEIVSDVLALAARRKVGLSPTTTSMNESGAMWPIHIHPSLPRTAVRPLDLDSIIKADRALAAQVETSGRDSLDRARFGAIVRVIPSATLGLRSKDTIKYVELCIAASPADSGLEADMSYVGTVRDITAQVLAELSVGRTDAIASSIAVSRDFLAEASHEIVMPLDAIVDAADALAADAQFGAAPAQYAGSIAQCGRQLQDLLWDIMMYSRMDESSFIFHYSEFDLRPVLAQTVAFAVNECRERDLEFAVVVDPRLPLEVKSDSAAFGKVLGNVLRSAMKRTVQGRIILFVTGEPLDLDMGAGGGLGLGTNAVAIPGTVPSSGLVAGSGAAGSNPNLGGGSGAAGVDPSGERASEQASPRGGSSGPAVVVEEDAVGGPALHVVVAESSAGFSQAHTRALAGLPSRAGGGDALALNICNQVIKHLNGDIGVSTFHSLPCVWFSVPLLASGGGSSGGSGGDPSPEDTSSKSGKAARNEAPIDLLVSDLSVFRVMVLFHSSVAVCEALAVSFRAFGLRVITVQSRADFASQVSSLDSSGIAPREVVFLVDEGMTSNNMTWALTKVAASHPDTPMVLMCSESSVYRFESMLGPLAATVTKPITLEGIIDPMCALAVAGSGSSKTQTLNPLRIIEASDSIETTHMEVGPESPAIPAPLMFLNEARRHGRGKGPQSGSGEGAGRAPKQGTDQGTGQGTGLVPSSSFLSPDSPRSPGGLPKSVSGSSYAPSGAPESGASVTATLTSTWSAEDAKGVILLVEDDTVNQIMATAMIQDLGFLVETATNGLMAVERIKSKAVPPIDIVLMDCVMPEMDGYEATAAIRKIEASRPGTAPVTIIACTAMAFAEIRAKCFLAGMDDFLGKPIQHDILANKLNFHMRKRQSVALRK